MGSFDYEDTPPTSFAAVSGEEYIFRPSIGKKKRTTKQKSSVVKFDSIQIREFNRIPGDHPCVVDGVPLTFGWEYRQKGDVSVDQYEQRRKNRRRSPENELRLDSLMRKFILLHLFHIPQHEILT